MLRVTMYMYIMYMYVRVVHAHAHACTYIRTCGVPQCGRKVIWVLVLTYWQCMWVLCVLVVCFGILFFMSTPCAFVSCPFTDCNV